MDPNKVTIEDAGRAITFQDRKSEEGHPRVDVIYFYYVKDFRGRYLKTDKGETLHRMDRSIGVVAEERWEEVKKQIRDILAEGRHPEELFKSRSGEPPEGYKRKKLM